MQKRVLAIGNCSYDQRNLAEAITRHFEVHVVATSLPAEALEQLAEHRFDLVLVNRILEADGSSGLDLIRQIKADRRFSDVPVMLVSNFPDAQQQAVEAGAAPGFGKKSLDSAKTITRLAECLG